MIETSLIDNLKSDYKSAEKFKLDNDDDVSKWLDVYNSKPYGNEIKYKSQYVSSMVKQMVGWQLPTLVEPFTSAEGIITCEPVTYEDVPTSEQAELLLNYQFTRDFDRFTFISDLMLRIMTEGTCFIKTSWEFEERTVTEMVPREIPIPMDPAMEASFMESMSQAMQQAQMNGQDPQEVQMQFMEQIPTKIIEEEITRKKIIKNRPTAVIKDSRDIRIDPTCRGDIQRAQFIIDDFETDLSSLRKDGRYKNLDKLEESLLERDSTYIQRENVDDSFKFQDDARKRFIVHEYWGNYDLDGDGIAEPVVIAYVDDIIIREDLNPLDDGTKPFVRAIYTRKPGFIYGEPLAEALKDKQRIDSVLNRGIFDDMKAANNGQRGTKKGFTDSTNHSKFKRGDDFEYNTAMSDVWEGKYTPISQSVFAVLNANQETADSIGGIKGFAHGSGGNSLGSTAAAVNATTTSSAKREMQIIRGVAEEAIIPMLEIWLAYDALFLEEEEVVRITSGDFVQVNRDDLDGNIDIKMSISTQESKAMKADRLAFLMQTMGNSMPREEANVIISDLMEINDMPHLAEKIANMPPPEPSEEEKYIQKLQIQLLEAQVQNEFAKARENEIDFELKSAKTQNELAKARNLESDSDNKDLDFLMKDEGEDHQRELETQGMKDNASMNQTKVQEASKLTQERMKSQDKAKNGTK